MSDRADTSCLPLKTVEEVLSWKKYNVGWAKFVRPISGATDYCADGKQKCHESVSRPQARLHRNSVPRTLLCHDMKGGYLEDRFLADSTKHDSYRFFHWSGIDTFVYFSHYFVTIPPIGWINAGHLHGVKVLGTVITEWKDGEAMWKEILKSDFMWQSFANALSDICAHYKFDGYILNIENSIEPELMEKFQTFLELFVDTMHYKINSSQVIWYDSITKDGKLDWQNELNTVNRVFFDKCDGIFLNYAWNERRLRNSVKTAGIRGYDVYVGVDVFGRKFYGGGGFQTRKALELIRKYNLSVAIFAHGWVYESFKKSELFVHREYAFWQLLWSHLFIHGPTDLPFTTSFCQGSGHKFFSDGKMVSKSNWFNLRRQQYQPCTTTCMRHEYSMTAEEHSRKGMEESPIEDHGCMSYYTEDAFQGGGCLLLKWTASGSATGENSDIVTSWENLEKEKRKKQKTTHDTDTYLHEGSSSSLSSSQSSGGTKTRSEKSISEVASSSGIEESSQKPKIIPELPESFYKRLLVCNFKCAGLMLLSVALKDVKQQNAKLDIILLTQGTTGKYSMKELFDTYSPHLDTAGGYPHPQPDILNKQIFEVYNRNLPKSKENSGWRINHYLFQVNGVIIEIGARLQEQGTEILLGHLSLYPYGR